MTAERIRSFIAVHLDPSVLQALQPLLHDCAACESQVRWVRSEAMHITLKFLGAVEKARLELVHAAVLTALRTSAPLRVQARGVGAFPSLRRPRVLWVGLHDGDGLKHLAGCVDDAVEPLGFAREQRAFRPHATIGRVNGLQGWETVRQRLDAHCNDDFGISTIQEVTIYRSELRRGGAQYTPLWTIPLTGNRGTDHDT